MGFRTDPIILTIQRSEGCVEFAPIYFVGWFVERVGLVQHVRQDAE